MVFHEITNEAIAEAIDNWRDLDMKLVEAQEGRRILDRLVGYEVSNVAFRRIGRGTSVGRVQSVATRLVVDRERARMAFHSGTYWDLEGTFDARRRSRSRRRSCSSTAVASRSVATSTPTPARSPPTPTSRSSTKPARSRSPSRLDDVAVHGRVGRDAHVHREAEGAVHHVDAAAGGGPQARLQRRPHDEHRPGPLRARPHHLHAHRQHDVVGAGGERGPPARSPASTATTSSPTSRASTAAR